MLFALIAAVVFLAVWNWRLRRANRFLTVCLYRSAESIARSTQVIDGYRRIMREVDAESLED